jgi:hypothetical protein
MRTFGHNRWSVALLGIAVGLLTIAANCHKDPEADITIVLEKKDGRCQGVRQQSSAADHDRLQLNFAIDNRCSATEWVAVSYTGSNPLAQCTADFPMLRWSAFHPGLTGAGHCDHPTGGCHRLLVMVEDGTVRPATPPSPIPACADVLQDHSLDFQPYP